MRKLRQCLQSRSPRIAKLPHSATYMLQELTDHELRQAVASLAVHGFSYCVANGSPGGNDFSPSLRAAQGKTQDLGGLLSAAVTTTECFRYHSERSSKEFRSLSRLLLSRKKHQLALTHLNHHRLNQRQFLRFPAMDPPSYFVEASPEPLHTRLAQQLASWNATTAPPGAAMALSRFEQRFRQLLELGERGRSFGDFAVFENDLSIVKGMLVNLTLPSDPQELLERAQICRNLAPVEFRLANVELLETSRRCWLVSAFQNSALTDIWATNIDQFVFDALGYLTVIQAEHRYASHAEGMLLLLRASHLICRISSSEELVPAVMYERAGRIDIWSRYAIGTVLAIINPAIKYTCYDSA